MPRDWKALKCTETWRQSLKDESGVENGQALSEEDPDSDPEAEAERDYAKKNGLPPPTVVRPNKECAAVELEKKKPPVAKVTQAKAARKARCRGVSGSMTKKQKSITHDDWDAMYDDDYDFVEGEAEELYDIVHDLVAEQDENQYDGTLAQDLVNQASGNGLSRNIHTSGTTAIDSQLKRQLSLDEPSKEQVINENLRLEANLPVNTADLTM